MGRGGFGQVTAKREMSGEQRQGHEHSG